MRLRLALLLAIATSAPVLADNAAPATTPATTRPTTAPASLFDPVRHMKVSEVRIGMKGYGLTVLSGTTIERFEVEVISTLHNSFGPQQDVVMIRCLGEKMRHYGPIAGCSGSPIYLYDDTGKPRLIGAYAFGFDGAKDPIVGVQPIEYMLRLTQPPAGVDDTGLKSATAPMTWSLLNAFPWRASVPRRSAIPTIPPGGRGLSPSNDGLRPLSIPLAVSGASQATVAALKSMFESHGFAPMLAPSSSAASTSGEQAVIEPGSVMGAAVLSGDLELTALGTCTEVVDGRAFGFGHPFNGEGATSIPMGAGAVSLVMPTLMTSFKLGGAINTTGAIDRDGTAGVAGQIGAKATTVPIHVEVRTPDDASPRVFNYHAALHKTFTPMMIATALDASAVAEGQLPVEHTASYSVTMKFAGGREVTLSNVATSLEGFDFSRDGSWPVSAAMDNPFGAVPVESVSAKVDITRGVRAAMVESALAARPTYRPGETARINVRLRKYKGEAFVKAVDVPLPATLKDGDFTITIGDAATNLSAESVSRPDRFAVRGIDELFATLKALTDTSRNDALYVRLASTAQGVAIGRTQLAKLPPSKRATLTASGRPDLAAIDDASLSIVPMDVVITGSADVTIHVKKKLP